MIAAILIILCYPLPERFRILDIILLFTVAIPIIYRIIFEEEINIRLGRPTTYDILISLLGSLTVFELCRRVTGKIILGVVLLFLGYIIFGQYIPGYWGHPGFDPSRLMRYLWLTDDGVFGFAMGAMTEYIFLFLFFGSFLLVTGAGDYFIRVSMAVTGRFRSGPPLSAVIASTFFGSINGAAIANVTSTGLYTIPLMKKRGFSPEFAGATEAAASSCGQITPPVMGSVAFIMAELLGIPYIAVCIASVIPALLHQVAVAMCVIFYTRGLKLESIPKEEMQRNLKDSWKVIQEGLLFFLSPIVLIVVLVAGYSPKKAALYAILTLVGTSMVKRSTRLNVPKVIEAVKQGVRGSLLLFAICALIGMIIVTVSAVGVAGKFSELVVAFAADNLFLALFFAMLCCVMLGMGMPALAAYALVAVIIAPAVVKLGIPAIAAHMFVFHFAITSGITPPVAMVAYTAAGLANGNPIKTALTTVQIAFAAFIVPYMFIYGLPLLMIGTVWEILGTTLISIIGITAIAMASMGYSIFKKLNPFERILIFASGVLLVKVGLITDAIGLSLFSFILALQYLEKRKRATRFSSPMEA
jgi:TRAP transporter 4TM/12TM fusion protein